MNRLKRIFFDGAATGAYAVITAVFTIVPEGCLMPFKIDPNSDANSVLFIRLLICVAVFLVAKAVSAIYKRKRKRVRITGDNYTVQVEYGNLLTISDGRPAVSFDECFTTKIGDAPSDIKPHSLCGQYLEARPIENMQALIDEAGVLPAEGKSEFNGLTRYTPGTIVPRGRDLLLAFARLDKNGRGYLTYGEYLDCLRLLWRQIDLYHGTDDVCVPILGSNILGLDRDLTQQELLDIMISSYILSPKRLKNPYKLRIVCRGREGFSLDHIKGVD